jgi:hypothetical protein
MVNFLVYFLLFCKNHWNFHSRNSNINNDNNGTAIGANQRRRIGTEFAQGFPAQK